MELNINDARRVKNADSTKGHHLCIKNREGDVSINFTCSDHLRGHVVLKLTG